MFYHNPRNERSQVIRIHKPQKDTQHNDQEKKDNDLQNTKIKDRVTP